MCAQPVDKPKQSIVGGQAKTGSLVECGQMSGKGTLAQTNPNGLTPMIDQANAADTKSTPC